MAAKTTNFVLFQILLTFNLCIAVIDLNQEAQYYHRDVNLDSYDLHFDVHHRQKRQASQTTETPGINSTMVNGMATAGMDNMMTTESQAQNNDPTTVSPPMATSPNASKFLDNHKYYSSETNIGSTEFQKYWKPTSDFPGAIKHQSLSNNYRTASTVTLNFEFPFYGHLVKKATIATGGFVYLSDFLHQWLTATQYASPLMANFDTTLGNESHISYVDTADMFIVWWERLHLKDDYNAGPFTFQLQLHKTGHILFVYKEIPKKVTQITTANHPVKVGLSDAYYYDTTISGNIRRRTIYEYHRVEIDLNRVNSNVVVMINPVTTCLSLTTCTECVTVTTDFNCQWCASLPEMRCSDGLDRYRQQWLESSCHTSQGRMSSDQCPPTTGKQTGGADRGALAGVVVIVLLIVAVIAAVTGWFVYAYRNPNSSSGRWLIEHRPSELRQSLSKVKFWKKDDAAEKYGVSMGAESVA